VKVRQHRAICGQRGMKEEQHWRDHPRHQEGEENPCIPRLTTDGHIGMGEDGRTSIVRLIFHIPSKLLEPLSSAMRLDRKERVLGAGAFCDPLLGPGPLGSHGRARGEGQGAPKKCGREEGQRRDAFAAKGQRLLPKTLYKAWAWAHRPFDSRINPSLLSQSD
jgi:hypothetical protein